MSKCKDTMGNTLEVGQTVTIMPPANTIWVAKITEVHDGGLMLSIDKNNKGMTPAKVRVVLDITLQANPNMPIFPQLARLVTPQGENLVDQIMKEAAKEPPPSGPITM